MKTCLIVLFTVGVFIASSVQAQQPTRITVPKDYGTTRSIVIDGKTISRDNVLDQLMRLAKRQGEDAPLSVILSDSARFTDWSDVRGILWKVGFNNIRYFVQSAATGKLAELKEVNPTVGVETPTPNQSP